MLAELRSFKHEFETRFVGNSVELILVDDGSVDGTARLLDAADSGVRVLRQPNRGYGAALKAGFREARGSWIGFLDADGTYPAVEFFALLEKGRDGSADLVIGSRLANDSSGMPAIRQLGNRSFSRLLGLASSVHVQDVASGMRIFRRERVSDLEFLPDGLNFTPAMTTCALNEAWKVEEVPIRYLERVGDSKLSVLRDGVRFAYDILSISWMYNPLRLLGSLGAVLWTCSVLLLLPLALTYISVRAIPEGSIYRLLTALLLWVIGLETFVCGALGASMARMLHRKPVRSWKIEQALLSQAFGRLVAATSVGLVVAAVALSWRGLMEYVSTGFVDMHWSRVLVSVILILTAVQLVLFRVLSAYLEALNRRFGLGRGVRL